MHYQIKQTVLILRDNAYLQETVICDILKNGMYLVSWTENGEFKGSLSIFTFKYVKSPFFAPSNKSSLKNWKDI